MSNTNAWNTVDGFWTRLKRVLEEDDESREERLERRVSRLEVEVERLLASDVGTRRQKSA
jgi:hypothetical protein